MSKFSLFAQSEKNPGQLDPWSIVFPVAFDLVLGVLLIILGDIASLVTAYVLAGLMIVYAIWLLIKYIRSTTMEKIISFRLSGGLALLVTGVLLLFSPRYLEDGAWPCSSALSSKFSMPLVKKCWALRNGGSC